MRFGGNQDKKKKSKRFRLTEINEKWKDLLKRSKRKKF